MRPVMRATESPAPGPRHIVEHGMDWTILPADVLWGSFDVCGEARIGLECSI